MANNYNLLKKDSSDAISGFYYDQQLKNEGQIVTLHPNMDPTNEPYDYWEPNKNAEYGPESTNPEVKVYKYSRNPLVRAVLAEDFQVAVSNQWEESSIADSFTGFFNDIKGFAPMATAMGDALSKMHKAGEPMENTANRQEGRDWQNMANKLVGAGAGIAKLGDRYLNRALVMQGARFVYYNGSSVGFGNMNMKFTLFSDWDENGKWTSCIDKLKGEGNPDGLGLIDYCIGKYVDLKDGQEIDNSNILKEQLEFFNEFAGWQVPPGGFKADLKSVDNIQKGTLMLIIGNMYAIPNLVIQDAQFNFSKQMVKEPLKNGDIGLAPMSCDVQITLRPASKYTGESFMTAVEGTYIQKKKDEYINNLNNRLKKRDMTVNKGLGGRLENLNFLADSLGKTSIPTEATIPNNPSLAPMP